MFKNVFGNGFEYEESFLDSKRMDINNVIKDEPFMHTFIFIKDILRCAKTKYKRYLGVEYERYAPNTYDSTIIQGSVGRLTGYDDNGDSVCFTNMESIEKYQTLWESSFMAPVNWYSGTTRKDGKRNAKLTYNSINLYENTGDIKPPQQVIPFIKWLGGKTKNLGKILCKFPAVIDNYYEPFLGGGSVLFGLLNSIEEKRTTLRGNIYISDSNSALIGTYKNIQLHCDELIAELKRIYNDYETAKPGTVINKKATTRQEGMASQESYYYYCRSEYNKIPKNQKTTITASALFIFINRTCFKGLFREGPRGLNMAYGHYVDISLNDEIIDNIRRVSIIIRNVIITDHSYTVALADVKDNDVVYMDPPHLEKKKKCAYDFDEKEYKKLFAICDNLAERCTVIFSGENKNYIKNHFSNNIVEYEINESKTRSAINAKRPGKLVEELLIRNLRQ